MNCFITMKAAAFIMLSGTFLSSCQAQEHKFCGESFYILPIKGEKIVEVSNMEDFKLYTITLKGESVFIYEGNAPNLKGVNLADVNEIPSNDDDNNDFYYKIIETKKEWPSRIHIYGEKRGVVASHIQNIDKRIKLFGGHAKGCE